MHRTLRLAAGAAVAALLLAAPHAARADVIERGYVVAIEAGEIYFDIGATKGAAAGNPLRLKRPITITHPVTGKPVRDELPLGETTVGNVRDHLAMATPDPELLTRLQVGDVVEVLVPDREPAPAAPTPEPEPEPELPPLPQLDPDTAAVLATWEDAAGKRVDVRIAAWTAFLEAHPDSRYAGAVRAHLDELHALREAEPPEGALTEPELTVLAHDAPTRARHGAAIPLAFAITGEHVVAAWVHVRPIGADSYRRIDLARDGARYFRGELPAADAPGVEYFVEVATAVGRVGTAVGTPAAPLAVAVTAPPQPELFVERGNRSRVSVTASYLSFGDDDAFWLYEADFFLRLYRRLHGVRAGFGVINGRGGYADPTRAEDAGFNYGFTEVELHLWDPVALLVRGVAGLGEEGLGFGAETRVRVGAEHATNLSFAVSSLEEIGFLSEIRMQWVSVPLVPLGFAVAVTDRPNRGDLGVRLSADVGFSGLRSVRPTLRLSYQGRTVDHAGLGAGLGLVFDW